MDIVLVIPEDSIILDLGTGHGLVLIKFASKISSEGHVTGIDLWKNRDQSNNSFKSTQQLLQEKNLENRSDLKTADMIELPFENKKYDFVTASMAIHNIKPKQNRYKALDEATRVLKTEGLLIILDTGNHKKEYLSYLIALGYRIKYAKTYGIIGWWTGPWISSYAIIAEKNYDMIEKGYLIIWFNKSFFPSKIRTF